MAVKRPLGDPALADDREPTSSSVMLCHRQPPPRDAPDRRSEVVSGSVEDTWASRDLPVLEAIVSAFNDPERFQLRIPELVRLCGLLGQDVITALRALGNTRPPLLEHPRPPEELTHPIIITDVTERARRLVGQWPTAESLAGEIAKALTEAAEHEPDPVKKSRLREAGAVLGDTARGVLVEVLSRIVERQARLG